MQNKHNFLRFVLFVGDIVLMYFSLLLALAMRYGDFSFLPGPQTRIFLFNFSFIFLTWIFLLALLDFYEIPPLIKTFDFFYNLIIFLILASTVSVAYFYLKPEVLITPKTILALDIIITGFFLVLWRYLFNKILRLENFQEKIIVIGYNPNLKEIVQKYLKGSGYEISAFFEPGSYPPKELTSISNLAKYGTISDISKLREIINKEGVVAAVFPLELQKEDGLMKDILNSVPLTIDYIPFSEFYESLAKKVPLEAINEIWFLRNLSRVERKIDEIFKRSFDIFFSFLGLLVTAILFPFIALAIKTGSRGPIFYSQKRVGKDGKVFTLYKFRTLKEASNQNRELWREKDKSQITRVGQFLRNAHLDEFPQLWSILKGDLSFVGPRPEWVRLAKEFEKKIPFYPMRYLVRPGFTGWAQINFPASTSVEEAKEKFQYDLYYIKNRSFFLDLSIILKTLRIIFR